jgi:hypothetical protein
MCIIIFIPRRMRHRVMVVVLSVSVSVTTKSAAYSYLISTSKTKFHRVLYGVFKVFVMWLLLKMLRSRVLASFAGHHCLYGELSMDNGDTNDLFSTRRVCMVSHRSNKTTCMHACNVHSCGYSWYYACNIDILGPMCKQVWRCNSYTAHTVVPRV